MPNRAKSTHGRVDKHKGRGRAYTRSERESPGNRIPVLSRHCAVCNLTFASQERRVCWDEKAAHPACVRRIRRLEAA